MNFDNYGNYRHLLSITIKRIPRLIFHFYELSKIPLLKKSTLLYFNHFLKKKKRIYIESGCILPNIK